MTTREDPIEAAVEALERGEVVALPTETVYGLAADASNPDAIERLFELKGRPTSVPLPLAVAAVEWVPHWASVDDPRLERLARRWWPGPLTVVLPARDQVSRVLTGGRTTIAVRVPDQEQARAVIARFGRAVALTSANAHGEPEARSAEEVAATFGVQVAAIVDGGPSSIGEPSTIVALADSEAPKILRRGALSESQVLEALK